MPGIEDVIVSARTLLKSAVFTTSHRSEDVDIHAGVNKGPGKGSK